MRSVLRVGFLLGLSAFIALIVHEGAGAIFGALSRAGPVLLWLLPLNAASLLLDVSGWRLLIPNPPSRSSLFLNASIRQGINRLLPVAGIGGDLVGIRLLSAEGVAGTAAAASVAVEILLTLVSQYLFVAIGVLCLFQAARSLHLLNGILLGLGVSLPMIALMTALLRHGSIFARIEKFASRVVGRDVLFRSVAVQAAQLDETVRNLLCANARLSAVVAWQLAGHLVASAESWLVLYWLGHPISVGTAIVLESLTMAARNLVFLVPAGLGVQELTLIGLGSFFGLSTDLAITLSLAKRVRELLYGLPSLLLWQWMEARGLKAQRQP